MNVANHRHANRPSAWQADFVEILPELQQRLRQAFRHLDPESREDALANGITLCLLAYLRLHQQGRADRVRPSSLVWYARLQIRSGRQAACHLNSWDPLSRYAQLRQGIRPPRRRDAGEAAANWIDSIVSDRRSSIPEQVIVRLDFAAWFAKDLAYGYSTAETAHKFRVTAGRISQLRRVLEKSWAAFQHESV